jgi:hypothetical protein
MPTGQGDIKTMTKTQTKSKQRVADHGEVFTAEREVNAMLDLVKQETERIAGGKGLDAFREAMLTDDRMRVIHDYPQAFDCFPGVQIKGGVCFFLWDRDTHGECTVITHKGDEIGIPVTRKLLEENCDTFIRYNL